MLLRLRQDKICSLNILINVEEETKYLKIENKKGCKIEDCLYHILTTTVKIIQLNMKDKKIKK